MRFQGHSLNWQVFFQKEENMLFKTPRKFSYNTLLAGEPYSYLCLRAQETVHLDFAITLTTSNLHSAISELLTQPANFM